MTEDFKNGVKICFVLDHKLMHYRVPFFERLASKGYQVDVFHPGKNITGNFSFSQNEIKSLNILRFEYRMLPKLNNYEVVIHMQNLRVLNLWLLTLKPFKRYKLIHWGIGVSSANGLSTRISIPSVLRNALASIASAQILYSSFPLSLFSRRVRAKTFIANNTIDNPLSTDLSGLQKSSILFIGSLNSRKGLSVLISSFLKFIEICKPQTIKTLKIIGEGSEKDQLLRQVSEHPFHSHIQFLGRIEDDKEKMEHFKNAAISVSPKQAGLSVLESFSYGVPFMAFENCISGGEHLNIINGKNGFLVKSDDNLIDVFRRLDENPTLSKQLGINSFEYYHSSRKMEQMVEAFESALKYVLKK